MKGIKQLIDEVADEKNNSLGSVLLKAKVLAHGLKSRKFRQWINSELDGYTNPEQLPDYRLIPATCFGTFGGMNYALLHNVPLSISEVDAELKRLFDTVTINEGVGVIESLSRSPGQISEHLPFSAVKLFRKYGTGMRGMMLNQVEKSISKQSLNGVLQTIRSRLLDFLLELRDKHPELDRRDPQDVDVSESEIDDVLEGSIYNNCTIMGGISLRDVYNTGQAGAVGPSSKAENINFTQTLRGSIGNSSLADLANELETLRAALLHESKSEEQDQAVTAVAEAETAAKRGDAKSVLSHLKVAGKWALDAATKIGTTVAANAIEASMKN